MPGLHQILVKMRPRGSSASYVAASGGTFQPGDRVGRGEKLARVTHPKREEGVNTNAPRRTIPARRISRWDTISASLGVSRRIGKKYRERRIDYRSVCIGPRGPHKPDQPPKRKSGSEFDAFLRQPDEAQGTTKVMVHCTTSLMTN
jgi:hypothetical protein